MWLGASSWCHAVLPCGLITGKEGDTTRGLEDYFGAPVMLVSMAVSGLEWAFMDAYPGQAVSDAGLVGSNHAGSIIMAAAGVYVIIRSITGNEFFVTGIGGGRYGKPIPNWIARPLAFLTGVGALVISVGLWRQT